MLMREHGLRIYAGGIVLHSDRRKRVWSKDGIEEFFKPTGRPPRGRGRIKAFTEASRKRLELIAASAGTPFKSLLTLTYHARTEAWEDDAARNGRIVARSKRDLNRFLSAMRQELGAYLWIQEFQARGVVHYHLLSEHEIEPERASVMWCRASGELDDEAALRHAVRVDAVKSDKASRKYVGRYLGKARQKLLPPGVEAGKRWWGRSRSLALGVLADVVVLAEGETVARPTAARVVRCLRRFLSGELGYRFRGGAFPDWGGALAARAASLVDPLEAHFRRDAWDTLASEVAS